MRLGESAGGPDNMLVRLYRLAHRQQENFTTEALAHLLQHLVAHEEPAAGEVLVWLTGLSCLRTRDSAAPVSVRTQACTEEHAIPDLRIEADDLDVIIEVKLDGSLTLDQADAYAKELAKRGRPNRALVALLGAAPQNPLPPGTVVRTWGELGQKLAEEANRSPSEVTRHLADQLVGLLRHLHLMPLRVRSPLSAALQRHRTWADAHPDQPSITRTRLRSLPRLREMPDTEPLGALLSQMGWVLSHASGVKRYAFDSGPNMREPWIGFNINDMAYFFYVSLAVPEHVILQRYLNGVDPTAFDRSLGTLEPATPKGLVRWRDTLNLLDAEGAFFRAGGNEQIARIADFFKRGFAFGEHLRPQSVTGSDAGTTGYGVGQVRGA